MDEFVPQSPGLEVKEGHEESDLSVRGIVTFGVILAISGILTFVVVRGFMSGTPYVGLEWWEKKLYPVSLTPAEQQLKAEREARLAPREVEAERVPESYPAGPGGRAAMEEHLKRTFPTPRLQYDDVRDMDMFRGSEEKWLESSGKDANGNIHIPVDQAMNLLVQRGLPQVSGPFAPPTLPSAAPLVPAPAAQHR